MKNKPKETLNETLKTVQAHHELHKAIVSGMKRDLAEISNQVVEMTAQIHETETAQEAVRGSF